MVALVKPQFEARRGEVGRGGVIRDEALRDDILMRVEQWLSTRDDLELLNTIPSPITGDAGNHEFLALLRKKVRQRRQSRANPLFPPYTVIPAQAGIQTPVSPTVLV